MSFFLPGRSLCALCEAVIGALVDAARIPYVDPASAPSLTFPGNPHVHRPCWDAWTSVDAFAAASEAVYARPGNPATPLVARLDHTLLFEVPMVAGLRIVDVRVPVQLDLRRDGAADLRTALLAGVGRVGLGAYDTEVEPADGGVRVTLRQAGEPVEAFTLSAARRGAWLLLLEALPGWSGRPCALTSVPMSLPPPGRSVSDPPI
jgi:hypothetical protein